MANRENSTLPPAAADSVYELLLLANSRVLMQVTAEPGRLTVP